MYLGFDVFFWSQGSRVPVKPMKALAVGGNNLDPIWPYRNCMLSFQCSIFDGIQPLCHGKLSHERKSKLRWPQQQFRVCYHCVTGCKIHCLKFKLQAKGKNWPIECVQTDHCFVAADLGPVCLFSVFSPVGLVLGSFFVSFFLWPFLFVFFFFLWLFLSDFWHLTIFICNFSFSVTCISVTFSFSYFFLLFRFPFLLVILKRSSIISVTHKFQVS